MGRISDKHLEHFREHGYAIVERFLDADTLARVHAELPDVAPTEAQVAADPAGFSPRMFRPFPFPGPTLNDITVHPDLLDFVARAVGSDELYVTQSQVGGRYGAPPRPDDEWTDDQPIHVDFGNNTLLVPTGDPPFLQVAMILYYTDVTADKGPTTVVSRQHTRDDPLWPSVRSREDNPEYYEREVAVTVPAGSALIYEMRTFHRGSKFHATSGVRLNHHLVFRVSGAEWMGFDRGRAWSAHEDSLVALIERATPRQRQALGWPMPGHPYWTAETVAGVARRYPGADMTPYERALA